MISPVLQVSKLRPCQGHRAGARRNQFSHSGSLAPEPALSPSHGEATFYHKDRCKVFIKANMSTPQVVFSLD